MISHKRSKQVLWITIICGFFGFAFSASAAEMYVDAAAADGGNGTDVAPYNTLNRALLDIVPGEANTIHATGVFHEYVKVGPEYGGTSEETRTTLQAWQGRGRPVNDARGSDIPGDIIDLTGAYITLRGFEVIGAKQAANIWSGEGAHHVIVEDNISHGAYGDNSKGICFRNSRDAIIRNNTTYNNEYVGIYIPGQGSVNVEVYNNTSYENGRFGIHGKEWADNLHIHHNTVYSNGYMGDLQSISGIGYASSSPRMASGIVIEDNTIRDEQIGVYIERGNDLRISNNVIDTGTSSGVEMRYSEYVTVEENDIQGFAFAGVSSEWGENIRIEHNILRGNGMSVRSLSSSYVYLTRNELLESSQAGVSVNDGTNVALENNIIAGGPAAAVMMTNVELSQILHNTIVNNKTGLFFTSPLKPQSTATVFNNIFHDLTNIYVFGESNTDGVRLGHNAYSSYTKYAVVQGVPRTRNGFCLKDGKDCTSLDIRNPRFVNESTGDFHLRWDSPLIGQGDTTKATLVDIDGEDRLGDGRVDIGADEVRRFLPTPGISDFQR
ncbi:MAG: right-handed parallel beta-helix repeat-containing protein [Candidatus Kerfeldbacteria bacterium]|nr:right-handed parallel beta-helix repeat-containing protein [Candidatus Kerfeldbacteria bacterium]